MVLSGSGMAAPLWRASLRACLESRPRGVRSPPPPSGGRSALRRPLSSQRDNVPSPEGDRSPKKGNAPIHWGNVPPRSWNIPQNRRMFHPNGRNIPQSVGTLSLPVRTFPKPLEHSPSGLEHSPKVWNVLPGPRGAPRKRGNLLPVDGAIVPGGEELPRGGRNIPPPVRRSPALKGLSRHPLK